MRNKKSNSCEILYILTIYNCSLEQSATFQTLIASCEEAVSNTFIYDNSFQKQQMDYRVATYIHDTNNSGLGKAYNEACKFALEYGYKWLLLLDQDTTFPPNALGYYKKAAKDRISEMIVPRHRVSSGKYMSPTPYRMKTSSLKDTAPTGIVEFKQCAPINSGMLVSVESFQRVGGYDEKVWLDFSDVCFIEKYKKHYKSFYVMPEVTCQQTFSALEQDPVKVYKRFCIYLECARNFPKHSIASKLAMLITTLRPMVSRTIKGLTLKYAKAYFKIYILGKKAIHSKQ